MSMNIRGAVLLSRKLFVEEHFGQGAWERILSELSEEDQDILKGILVHVGWYPFEFGERLDQAIVDVFGNGNPKVFEEIGAKSAQKNLSDTQNAFLTPGDPQAFLTKTPAIYALYYDHGRREYKATGANSGILSTHEADTFSSIDCLTIIGWYKKALMMCGAAEVQIIEEECRARGGKKCTYRVSWGM